MANGDVRLFDVLKDVEGEDISPPWEDIPFEGDCIIRAVVMEMTVMEEYCRWNFCSICDALPTNIFGPNVKKAMDDALREFRFNPTAKSAVFNEQDEEDGTVHSVVFFRDSVDGKELNLIVYYHFRGRLVEIPPLKVLSLLISDITKQIHAGRMPKEYLLAEAYRIFSSSNAIPVGINNAVSVSDVVENPCFYHVSMASDYEEGELALSSGRRILAAYKMFQIADTPTWLEPTYNLCLALIGTRLSGVMCDDIILPHPSVAFELPENLFNVVDILDDRNKSILIQLFEEVFQSGDRHLIVVVFFTIEENGEDLIWAAPLVIPLKRGKGFSSVTPTLPNDMVRVVDNVKCFVLDKEVTFTDFASKLSKFAINLLLYMNSQGTCSEKRKSTLNVRRMCNSRTKKKNKRYRNLKVCEYDTWVIGTDVKLDSRAQSDISNSNTGRRISYSFITRGHWCNQAYGPNWSLKRRIWRKPSIKGKGLGDKVVSHSYKLDKKEK